MKNMEKLRNKKKIAVRAAFPFNFKKSAIKL